MPSAVTAIKKKAYFERLGQYVSSYPQILIANVDHVGSKQMADIRLALRGKAIILMGKNTLIKTGLKQLVSSTPEVEKLINLVRLNVGLIFCISDLTEVRDIVNQYKVPAPARQGVIAPIDVVVPGGGTGLDPSQTSFFQALGIATKIVKGQIEIQGDVNLIKKDDKVTASQAALLQKLNIKPFTYGLEMISIYNNGSVYSASVLDITTDHIVGNIRLASKYIAAFSRSVGIPSVPSVRDCILESFKYCIAVGMETEFSFAQMEAFKNAGSVIGGGNDSDANVGAGKPSAAAAAVEESESEDEDLGFSLFG